MQARIGATALLALVTVALAGCAGNPPQTQQQYEPSDGISVSVGDLRVVNMIVLTDDGENGNLIGTAVNSSDEDIDVIFQWEGDGGRTDVSVEVPADSTLDLGYGEEGQLLLEGIDAEAGDLIQIYVQYGDEQGQEAQVPVLDGSLPEYSDYLPTPSPTTPTE